MSSIPGVRLYTVECSINDSPFYVTSPKHINHLQVSCSSSLWLKENLLNLLIKKIPAEANYIAWVDADVYFCNEHWADEAMRELRRYELVQLFEDSDFLGWDGEVAYKAKSFAYYARQDVKRVPEWSKSAVTYPHPGYAWAMTREYYNRIGGFLDFNVVGSGDKMMAFAAIGMWEEGLQKGYKLTDEFLEDCRNWAKNAVARTGLGYVSGKLIHYYHGERKDRDYVDRWKLLENYKFNQRTDLAPNSFGVLELQGHQS
jgi:hypothetical protein